MTYEELKRIVAGDESRTLELKKTTGELKDAMHTACAMLNTEGGWVVFGVAPKPIKILGQQVSDDTRREIAHALIRQNGTQDKVTNGTQTLNDKTEGQQVEKSSGTQAKDINGTQAGALKPHSRKDKTVIKNLDEWIESMIVVRPKITTGELAQLSGWGVRTIKRHIAQMPHIKYVGSGYTGHWEVTNKENE